MAEAKSITREEMREIYRKQFGDDEGDRVYSSICGFMSERWDESRRETRRKEWSEYGFERAILCYAAFEYSLNGSDKKVIWKTPDNPPFEKALSLTDRRKKYEAIYKAITSSGRKLINLDQRLNKFTLPQLEATDPFFPDNDAKNTAFTLLFLWLDHSIKLDHLKVGDCESLKKIAIYYYYLAQLHCFVSANHDEAQDFIKRFIPNCSPSDALALMREDFATCSGPILEHWYANHPKAREAVDYKIKQNAGQSKGGKERAKNYKKELHGGFADAAVDILRRHPDWKISSIANILAKEYRAEEEGKQLTSDAMRKRLSKLYEEHGGKEGFLEKYP